MICTLFFREHAWGTWDRLRASAASSLDLVVGKVVPLYACLLVQMAAVFGIGVVAFGYRPNGSWLALGATVAVFVAHSLPVNPPSKPTIIPTLKK